MSPREFSQHCAEMAARFARLAQQYEAEAATPAPAQAPPEKENGRGVYSQDVGTVRGVVFQVVYRRSDKAKGSVGFYYTNIAGWEERKRQLVDEAFSRLDAEDPVGVELTVTEAVDAALARMEARAPAPLEPHATTITHRVKGDVQRLHVTRMKMQRRLEIRCRTCEVWFVPGRRNAANCPACIQAKKEAKRS